MEKVIESHGIWRAKKEYEPWTCQFSLYEIKKCIVPFSLGFPKLYN